MNETMGSAVSSVGDLLEFGVGDLVDMFSVTQKQVRTITVGSMDSTTDAIFTKLDGTYEVSAGGRENTADELTATTCLITHREVKQSIL